MLRRGAMGYIHYLQDTFDIQEIIVSKGSKGALYVHKNHIYDYPAITVEVKDTVGSGDSFLAGFISKRLEQLQQHMRS
jgi:fructokinase